MKEEIRRELHDLDHGNFAYTQLPGSWGWSNSGLITDGDESLLIDTLFDRKLTAEMLAVMRDAAPAARAIRTVVNTHGNGDHCFGNGVVGAEEIIGTPGCVEDLLASPASRNRTLLNAARVVGALGWGGRLVARVLNAVGIDRLALLADAGPFALPLFEPFDFKENPPVPPTRTFEGELTLRVGDKEVRLIEVGPAHTLGDCVVYLPGDRLLYTGDILFKDAHPLVWTGPVSNWIAACDRLCELEVDVVVPGHGPLTTLEGLREARAYLKRLTEQARDRFDAGMTAEEAAWDIQLEEFTHWIDAERIYVNVDTLYREFAGDTSEADVLALFAGMGRLTRSKFCIPDQQIQKPSC
jgi:glyoxylase-like metal-dependent hydrolase (beta-lactamase superfamily II)